VPNAVPLLGQVWRSSWHGLLVAVILALLQLLRRVAWPHDAVLTVSDDGTPREAAPDESDDTWVLIYRVDAPLFFANANRIHHRLLTLAGAWSPYPRYVVLDTGAVFHVDATAAQVLARLSADLREHHCELVLAHPRGGRSWPHCAPTPTKTGLLGVCACFPPYGRRMPRCGNPDHVYCHPRRGAVSSLTPDTCCLRIACSAVTFRVEAG
jgi:hypothetical protein